MTGLYACVGIQGALLERTQSGKGQKLDLSLYDSAVSALVNVGSNYLMAGKIPAALGNQHANIVPYQTFSTMDGEMVIAVGNDNQFRNLCNILGKPEYASDERFRTNPDRVANRETLIPMLQEVFSTGSTAYWQKQCQQNNIPCGPIQTIDEVANDPQLNERDMFIDADHPTAGDIRMIGSPLKLSRTPVQTKNHPPNAGEHNEELLKQFGFIK